MVRDILSIARSGVTLSGFSYATTNEKGARTFSISGIAATRDALRTYQLALSGAPFIQTVHLPVSAYAKDSDISFTLTVTLTP
jgi:hypothetical protein